MGLRTKLEENHSPASGEAKNVYSSGRNFALHSRTDYPLFGISTKDVHPFERLSRLSVWKIFYDLFLQLNAELEGGCTSTLYN